MYHPREYKYFDYPPSSICLLFAMIYQLLLCPHSFPFREPIPDNEKTYDIARYEDDK